MDCLTKFVSPQLKTIHRGKVRDSIRIDDNTRMIVVTDRISAFNKKIKTPIPTKGAVLNGIANFWFEQTKHIIGNHIIEQVDDYITLVKEAEPIRVEMVVRGYLTGSMWRGYEGGKRKISDVVVPDGMVKNQKFDQPILTPTTKDEDDTEIDEKGILDGGLVSSEVYEQMKDAALKMFDFGTKFLAERGIILVDTKYEFGLLNGKLIIIDEMHTPDSSRFWSAADYNQNPAKAEQIDKEFVRQWMLANKVDGEVPLVLIPDVIKETSSRYQDIYTNVTGKTINIVDMPYKVRIHNNLVKAGLIKQGAIAITVHAAKDMEAANQIQALLENYDVFARIYDISVTETNDFASEYNNAIEPVAVIAVSNGLADILASKMSVPVINCGHSGDSAATTASSLENAAFAALRSLNLPALRERLAAEIN